MRKVKNIAATCGVVVTMLTGASALADDVLAPVAAPSGIDPAAPPATATASSGNAGSSAAARVNPDGTITITGRAKPGSTVTTTFPDGSTGSAVAGPDGSYKITSGGGNPIVTAAARPSVQPPVNAAAATGDGSVSQQTNSQSDQAGSVVASQQSNNAYASPAVVPVSPQPQAGNINSGPPPDGAPTPTSDAGNTDASAASASQYQLGNAGASPAIAAAPTSAAAAPVPAAPAVPVSAAPVPAAPAAPVAVAQADTGDAAAATSASSTTAPAATADGASGTQAGIAAAAANKNSRRTNTVPPTAAVKTNTDGTITIRGRAKPGSTVTTTFPDGSTGTAKADSDGNYSITSTGPNGGKQTGTATAQAQSSDEKAAIAPDQKDKDKGNDKNLDNGSVVDAAALSADMSKGGAGQDKTHRLDGTMPAGPLTLDQAVLLAVSRHPSISSQIATIAQATGGVDVARAGYYPQVTMGTSANTIYAVPGQFGNPATLPGVDAQGNATQITNYRGETVTNKTLTMQITQMIYDFGKVSDTVDQAQATVKREEANLLQQISKIEQQTAEALINAHRYQVLVNIAAQQVDAVQQVYQMAKLRAGSGVSSRADPVQAQTRVQSAQATLISVKSLDDQTRQHLRTLVGGAVSGEIALPLDDDRVTALKLDATADPSTNEMPGVLVAQANELIASSQVDIAKAQMKPALTLNYTGDKAVSGYNTTTYAKGGFNQSVSFGLQWTAFQGGALSAQVRAAEHALDAARLTVASARLDGSDAARGYRDQALGAYSRLDKLAERRSSIELTRNLYREQYKLGSRSILDLLNAEQEYYQATLDEEAAKHDYWIALVDYIGALGTGNTFYGIASKSIQGVKVQ